MPEDITFIPPRKPEPLLQELYWPDKWKILVCCLLLNCTQRKQVDQVIETFFEKFATPQSLLACADEEIAETIKSLGFKNRRTKTLKKFSTEFLEKSWGQNPRVLYGVGEYAARCYEIMLLGKFGEDPPDDHALNDYWCWYMETHGKR